MQLELERVSRDELSWSELREHQIYEQLLGLSAGLEERLCTGSEQEVFYVSDLVTKGASSARSDDTKSLKAAIVDFITPRNGILNPPLQRNVKSDRGFHHEATGALLCPVNLNWSDPKIRQELVSGAMVPSADLWPRFVYRGLAYDPENPWDGLFRGGLLVSAYKHIFTSPSSVGEHKENRATRSCNARIHGMNASATFSRTDTVTDSEYFYNLVLELLEDPEESNDVEDLLKWWNSQIFPTYMSDVRTIHKDSVIAKIKERRRLQLQDRTQEENEDLVQGTQGGSAPST
ncbi:hypothetical protein EST38_g2 [Candolleomyces aberdarensis]|uniref:Uncharacterized protein n=1 Tax=Candolleomyces aberdarensis TaxID=2316362 RepID=A0A4Q2DYE3_9AGAR|nr:hypothetical protein EST38_g2 [Candolleomyces aberdarensis]